MTSSWENWLCTCKKRYIISKYRLRFRWFTYFICQFTKIEFENAELPGRSWKEKLSPSLPSPRKGRRGSLLQTRETEKKMEREHEVRCIGFIVRFCPPLRERPLLIYLDFRPELSSLHTVEFYSARNNYILTPQYWPACHEKMAFQITFSLEMCHSQCQLLITKTNEKMLLFSLKTWKEAALQ